MNIDQIIIAVISYCLGIITGIIANRLLDKTNTTTVDNSTLVLVIVTIIWAMSMVVDVVSPTYETSPLVHGLMGAIVGFYYKQKK